MEEQNLSTNNEIADYYDTHNILDELEDEEIEISLEGRLRNDIISGKRKHRLQNISIKIDPYQILAIKKIAIMKSIPYQSLIRHWLSQNIKQELNI